MARRCQAGKEHAVDLPRFSNEIRLAEGDACWGSGKEAKYRVADGHVAVDADEILQPFHPEARREIAGLQIHRMAAGGQPRAHRQLLPPSSS